MALKSLRVFASSPGDVAEERLRAAFSGDVNCPFDVQIVLLDRSNGTNNGDFDIEFNYGNGEVVPPDGAGCLPGSDGFRGIRLGPNSRGPTLGPFGPFDTSGAPIRFCFRGGQIGCVPE